MSVATTTRPAEASAGTYLRAAGIQRRHPDLSRVKLYRLALLGDVQTRLRPGRPPEYRVEDVDRLMAGREG